MLTPFDWTEQQENEAVAALKRAEAETLQRSEIARHGLGSITRISVIGGGTMGAGIAVALLNVGYEVCVIERDVVAADAGRQRVLDTLARDRKSGRIDTAGQTARQAAFSTCTTYQNLARADLVIEAVYEDLSIKRDVFARAAAACGKDTILATNTSYLDPESVFEGLPGPERCIGLHFFSPANIMKVVEIIPTRHSSERVVAASFALAAQCRKIPVLAGICDGFIGNRLLKVMRSQAERLVLFGTLPQELDSALRKFGMRMGPFEVQDLAGLDIAAYQRTAARDRGETVFAPVSDRLVADGRLGRKSGAGWYDYETSVPVGNCPAQVTAAIREARTEAGISQISMSDEMIVEVVLFSMLNEAANILAEGIAQRPADIDLVEVHGYGFPREKGGLAWFGTIYGLPKTIDRLAEFSRAGLCDGPSAALIEWANKEG